LIADGEQRSYLVGLGRDGRKPVLFVARIEANGDRPEAYAVLPGGTIDWSIFDTIFGGLRPSLTSTFGSAFTYDVGDGIVKPRLLFANNAGVGLFELVIPDGGIDINCWNSGTSGHVACGSGKFTIQWKTYSSPTPKNDGSACPRVLAPVLPGDPTFAPTISPAPTTAVPSEAPSAAPTPLPTTPMPSLESNGDGSSDARGNVRTDTRDGGAVLRADDGHLRAVGRADGHGGALAFGSAVGRADDGADAADSLDGGDDDIRARRRRGTPPPHPSPAHNSTHYITPRAFVLAAGKTLASAPLQRAEAQGTALGHMQAKALDGAAIDE